MAHPKLRGFFAKRKDLTVTVEKTVKTKVQILDKKGRPVIENGKPKFIIVEEHIKENPISWFIIRTNNAVPPKHNMFK